MRTRMRMRMRMKLRMAMKRGGRLPKENRRKTGGRGITACGRDDDNGAKVLHTFGRGCWEKAQRRRLRGTRANVGRTIKLANECQLLLLVLRLATLSTPNQKPSYDIALTVYSRQECPHAAVKPVDCLMQLVTEHSRNMDDYVYYMESFPTRRT